MPKSTRNSGDLILFSNALNIALSVESQLKSCDAVSKCLHNDS